MDFKNFIIQTLSKITSNKDFLDRLTDDESMALYDIAFTHSSVDPMNNYETLEFKGDAVLNCVSVIYLTKRFPEIKEEGLLTPMKHYVTEKPFFARMSRKLGFDRFIKIINIEEVKTKAKSINEDVFEAFNGALFELCEKKIYPDSGYAFVSNLVTYLLDDEEIPLVKQTLQKPRAVLKEIFEKNKFLQPGQNLFITAHEPRIIQGRERNINIARIVFRGQQIGYGEAFKSDDAKDTAARQALEFLKTTMGITPESAKEQLLREKRVRVDPLLHKYQKLYPNLDFKIHTIKKDTKPLDAPGDWSWQAIVGYYERQPNGKYQLVEMQRASTPEEAEENILKKLLG